METITYAKLSRDNFNKHSLDNFIRYQEVKECLRKVGNEFILVPYEFVENWDLNKCRDVAKNIMEAIDKNYVAYGASKVYISAHSSRESQEAYRGIGCINAIEINQQIAENEPYDIQMEYKL